MTAESSGSALLVVDLQNDFLHPDGAYGRGGVDGSALAPAVSNAVDTAAAARAAGVAVVATRFTLLAGPDGAPLISDHLAELRPFLAPGHFSQGSWGHGTIEALEEPSFAVDKVAYSAFAHTPLDWWLRRVGIHRLFVCGIVTNGGVASTIRAAHVDDYEVTLVSDASAAFRPDVHDAAVASLGSVVDVTTTADLIETWT